MGACQHDGCECSQYVAEGLTTGNRVLGVYGDHGKVATLDVLAPGDPTFTRYLPEYRARVERDDLNRRLIAEMTRNARR